MQQCVYAVEQDHSYDQYIDLLKKNGIIIHQSLTPAIFKLKNGLTYSGLKASQQLLQNQTLVKIPIELLITVQKALQQKDLHEVYKNKFYHNGHGWQYRVLITFALYTLKYKPQSVWANVFKMFPKNIDLLQFWEQQQVTSFLDKTILLVKNRQYNNYDKQWYAFQTNIKEQYSLFGDDEIFNQSNYRWIYIHTISRCFGSYLNCIYFVPFCQLFNHNCVEVSYKCVEQHINPNVQEISLQQQVKISTQKHLDKQSIQSQSSDNSQQFIQNDDFNYSEIPTYIINWCNKISYDLKPKQQKSIHQKVQDILYFLDVQIVWKGYSILYVTQILQKTKIIQNQYKAGRKKYPIAIEELQKIKLLLNHFKRESIQIFNHNRQKYINIKSTKKQQEQNNFIGNNNHNQDNVLTIKKPQKQYKYFEMETRQGAKFQKQSQVYFCYGKLSNRNLLIRYGFSLQNNKYQHVWIKLPMKDYLSPYPDTLNKILDKSLPIVNKIKIKRKICIQLILWLRMTKWQLTHNNIEDIFYITDLEKQIKVLKQYKDICENNLLIYGKQIEDITDQSIGYHQYFKRVYHNEKRNILLGQIQLIIFLEKILNDISVKVIQNHLMIQQVYQNLSPLMKRKLVAYFKGFKGLILLK